MLRDAGVTQTLNQNKGLGMIWKMSFQNITTSLLIAQYAVSMHRVACMVLVNPLYASQSRF